MMELSLSRSYRIAIICIATIAGTGASMGHATPSQGQYSTQSESNHHTPQSAHHSQQAPAHHNQSSRAHHAQQSRSHHSQAVTAHRSQQNLNHPEQKDANFTQSQKKEIVSIVKTALKDDPSILADALVSLQSNLAAHKEDAALNFVRMHPDQFKNSQEDVVIGNPMGSVTMTEFYDPRCPYCVHVLDDFQTLIAQEPQLRLVEKVIPVLGPRSIPDAQAILAASKQGAYTRFQHALMTNKSAPGLERIRKAAVLSGVDPDKLQEDMQSPSIRDGLSRNLELARQIGVDGTPTFVIGDSIIIPGAASYEELKNAVERVSKKQQ